MNSIRSKSSSDLNPSSQSTDQYDDSALEGVAANIKLLLKLIQDHKNACHKEQKDSRRMLRVAGMMTILDTVRTRIQKCQSFGNKRSETELRQCNTDPKPSDAPRDDKKSSEPIADEKEWLRKQLDASLAARKSLEIMCSSLGKEKEIMAAELARKNYELSGLEEHINDLRAQNESLLEKVKEFAADHDDRRGSGGESRAAALQERNKVLSEQLLRSLDGYRYMKRKLRDTQEVNLELSETMEEISEKIGEGLQCIRGLNDAERDFEEGASEVENVFECLEMMVSKYC